MNWAVCAMGNETKNYLPTVYENSKDSLYSHTVFQILSDLIEVHFSNVRILDLGCADKRSSRLVFEANACRKI